MNELLRQRLAKPPDRRADRYLREEEEDVSSQRLLALQAKAGAVEWMGALAPWDLYATLTYDQRRFDDDAGDGTCDAYVRSFQACARDVEAYRSALSAVLHREVTAAVAIEAHRNGWPHAHALLAMDGVNSLGFVRAGRLWWDNHGFALISRVDLSRSYSLAAYITKYFTKQNADVALLGPLRRCKNG